MANYVYNNGNMGCGPIEDAEVIVIPDEVPASNVDEALDLVNEDHDDDTLDVLSSQRISVMRLLNIAYLAVAVLDSHMGIASLSDLSVEVKGAGLGDFTGQFSITRDEGPVS